MIVNAYTKEAIASAVSLLKAGGLVAMPTETVYGLAADASNPDAVARIYALKGRPATNPLIVHVHEVAQLTKWAIAIPEQAYRLAAAFWPGPLTLILKKAAWVPDCLTAGQATIGLRIPAHPVALALLQAFEGGLAAPSANLFTEVSPTTALHVEKSLGPALFILDGGAADVGIESTIIDCTGPRLAILRPGMLSAAAIATVVDTAIDYHPMAELKRPGQHWLHYSPKAEVRLLSTSELLEQYAQHTEGFQWIAYSSVLEGLPGVKWLSSDPQVYARELYAALHDLDAAGCRCIGIELPPVTPAWYAVNERLHKAAGCPS